MLLFMVLTASISNAQSKTIKGVLTDEKGIPVVGASISVKGNPNVGTFSNEKGSYQINVPDAAKDTLVFSHIEYSTQEIAVNSNTVINLKMKVSQAKLLDGEVVVTALGVTRKQKSLTYSSQNIDPKSITEARDVSFLNTLQGKVAGLQITNTGQPGGSVRITLRGDNSLSASNQPLIVVDGVPIENAPGEVGNIDYGNAAANINPDDIESITVLKGPNGAALYGAKAANGAILITLKKGKPGGDGSLGIEVNQNLQLYRVTKFPEYQNVYGEGSSFRLSGNNVNNINRDNGGVNMGTSSQSWGAPMLGQPYNSFGGMPIKEGYAPQPNNVSDLYQTGLTSTTNLAISRSDANGAFRLSYGYVNGNDVIDNINLIKKHNVTLSATRNLAKVAKIEARVNYTNWNTRNRMIKNLDPSNPLAAYVYMGRSVRLDGFLPYRDADGNSIATGQVNSTENPYWSIYANSNEDTRSATNGAIVATVNVATGLKLRGQVVADFATTDSYIYKEKGSRLTPLGSYSNSLTRQNNMFYEVMATYAKQLNKDFNLDALAGFSVQDVNILNRSAAVNALLVHNMPSIANANAFPTATESLIRSRQQSAFARAVLGFKEMVYLEVSGRKEWSSTLPLENNSFFYPSIGGNFNFGKFINNKNIINSGKVRVNYAKVGNSTSPYQLQNTYLPQSLYLGNPTLAYTTQLKNADLKPEQQISKELGLELSTLKGKLDLSATLYQNSTINQIVSVQTPFETGFINRIINAGEIQNKGFELSANATIIRNRNVTWKAGLNYSKNISEVVSLLPNVSRIVLGGRLGMTVNALVGQPYGIHMGNVPYRVGDTILVANTGRVIAEPNVITGNPRPKWIGGFTNSVSFKGFTLQVVATVKVGGVVFSESYGRAMFAGTPIKSLEGRNDYFFSSFVLGETDNERRNVGQTVGSTVTRYVDSSRLKGLAYPNAHLALTGPGGVVVTDGKGRLVVGDKFLGWIYPQLVNGNDKVTNDVPALTFDATSVRIAEIVLGYTIPSKVFGNKGYIKGAYVAITGRNIWQIYQKTPYGIDPESTTGSQNGNLGIESGGSFPYAIMGFNLKLAF
jgi:TonB-linked SusC/RagA family outer membrane protein